MSDQDITLGGVRCVSARLVTVSRGVWYVDVDIDPDGTVTAASVPTGKQILTVGTNVSLVGTVEPLASGRWASGVRVRLLAGGGGWSLPVTAQDFSTTSGVSALEVENATASLVGETIHDPSPVSLGFHWERQAGPAAAIFSSPDRNWYVDTAGVTQVGTWPTVQPNSTVEILDFSPEEQRLTLSADAIVLPGTRITDAAGRFDGTLTVRGTEQTWSKSGTRITAWCSSVATDRLTSDLTNLVRALAGVAALKRYVYRIVSQPSPTTLNLQAVLNPDGSKSGAPDANNVPVWPGMQGLTASYKLGATCHVCFTSLGFSDPIVVAFDQSATTAVQVNGGTNSTAILGSTTQTNVAGSFTVSGGILTGLVAPSGGGPVTGTPVGTLILMGTAPCSGTITTGVSDLTLPSS
ncbi:MAG: hypothetical protein ACLP1D_10270 [Xanthobacteraceae bacterium]